MAYRPIPRVDKRESGFDRQSCSSSGLPFGTDLRSLLQDTARFLVFNHGSASRSNGRVALSLPYVDFLGPIEVQFGQRLLVAVQNSTIGQKLSTFMRGGPCGTAAELAFGESYNPAFSAS
jgi:hypothetical protein